MGTRFGHGLGPPPLICARTGTRLYAVDICAYGCSYTRPFIPMTMTMTTRLASTSSSPASNGPPSLDLQNDPTTRTQTTTRRRRALPSPLTLPSCQDSGHGSGPCISQLGNDIFLSTSGMRSNRHARYIPSPPPLSSLSSPTS